MIQPTGADARGQNWHADQSENLPTKAKKKFGRLRSGDRATFATDDGTPEYHDITDYPYDDEILIDEWQRFALPSACYQVTEAEHSMTGPPIRRKRKADCGFKG